jgi:hypothetical protein
VALEAKAEAKANAKGGEKLQPYTAFCFCSRNTVTADMILQLEGSQVRVADVV